MVNSSNKVLTIDQRIVKDLNELNTMGEIQDAKKLDGLIKAKVGQTSFATKALPGYYAGNRDAKTVMVMLNPGVDVDKANGNLMADIQKRSMKDVEDLDNYHKWSVNYGHEDKGRKDNFDLKQAFFLNKWIGTEISLPNCLSVDSDRQTKQDAKEIVLTQKLQMELIPYGSSSFSALNHKKLDLIVPFVETLFEEIFLREDRYVIFCSRLFEDVFKKYNEKYPDSVEFKRNNNEWKPFRGDSKPGHCIGLIITHNGKKMKALIANTFPRQDLQNAYDLMEAYGEFCYNEYIKL
jgi:hypothetical protein